MARPEVTGRAPRSTPGRAQRTAPLITDEPEIVDDPDAREPAPNADLLAVLLKEHAPIRGPPPAAVFSVPEFAKAHRISVSMLYKLWSEGLGPAVMKVGARTLITFEAAARWRAEREIETAK